MAASTKPANATTEDDVARLAVHSNYLRRLGRKNLADALDRAIDALADDFGIEVDR